MSKKIFGFFSCASKNKKDADDDGPYKKAGSQNEGRGIEDKTALLQEQTDEVASLKEKLDTTTRELQDAQRTLSDQLKKLDEANKDIQHLKAEVSSYKRKLEDAEHAKNVAEASRAEVEGKLKQASDSTDGITLSFTKDVAQSVTGTLENDLKRLEEERKSAQKELKDAEEKHRGVISRLQSQMNDIQKAKVEAEEKAQSKLDAVETSYKKTVSQLESQIDDLKRAKNEAESKIQSKEKDQLRDHLREDKDRIQQLQAQIEDMKKNLENEERSHSTELERIRAEHKQTIAEKDAENDTLLTRLSSATAAQVLDGNPNVSDLSDPNRPQKLGEQMGSLYDDQWTDACEELEKQNRFKDNETDIVKTLFELIKTVYSHCKEASDSQLSRIEEHIFLPPLENAPPSSPETNGTDVSPVKSPTSTKPGSKIPRFSSQKSRPALPNLTPGKKTVEPEAGKDKEKMKRSNTGSKVKGEKVPEIPVEVRKGIKEYRKKVAKQVIPVIEKEVFQKLRNSPEFGDNVVNACKPYITKCVEICWMMCVQDPPVCLKWDVPSDNKFETDRYRAYTKTGGQVDYMVWPIMCLYDGGPILVKGIAQGK